LQNITAATIIDFDPFTAGSPACPAECDLPSSLQIPALVQDIENLDPSNTTIQAWLSDYADGTANEPTTSQVDAAIALLQTGEYNFTPAELAQVDAALANINPELPALLTNDGVLTDPDYLTYITDPSAVTDPTTGEIESVYGGYDPELVLNDFFTLVEDAGSTPVDPTLSTDVNTVLTDFAFPGDPAALEAVLSGGTAASAAADPSLSTDLSTLLASLGTTTGSDIASQLAADLGTQLTTDLSTQLTTDLSTLLPQSLLGLF
jgi:hypothetical protein